MKTILRALCCALVCLGHLQPYAQSCNTTTLYGLTSGGLIYTINMEDAGVVSTPLYNTPPVGTSGANAMGFNKQSGKFYFWAATYDVTGNAKKGYTITNPKFVSFDPNNTSTPYQDLNVTNLAGTNGPGMVTIRTGCVSADGTGYYCLNNNGALWYYHIADNYWTPIDSVWQDDLGNDLTAVLRDQTSGDMAIDGYGNLWMLTASSTTGTYGLYKLNASLPTTPGASLVLEEYLPYTTPNPDAQTIAGIGFNTLGEIYISSLANNLYKMDHTRTPNPVGVFTVNGVGNDMTSCHFPMAVLQPVISLPVAFSSFEGKLLQDKTVQLLWKAATDEAHHYFEVERSGDGVHFASLGKSNPVLPYQFTDAPPNAGNNFYRIKQVDKDGKVTYSKTVNISLETAVKAVLYPNPASDVLNIVVKTAAPEKVTLKISDLQGKIVHLQNATTLYGSDVKVDISSWKPQFYIVTLYNSKEEVIATKKVMKY